MTLGRIPFLRATDPVLVGHWPEQPRGSAQLIAVTNNFAYLLMGKNLLILNVSNSVRPTLPGRYPLGLTSVSPPAVAGPGQLVSIADSDGLRIMDLIDPNKPLLSGFIAYESANSEAPHPRRIKASGGWISVEFDGTIRSPGGWVHIYDVRDPMRPTRLQLPFLVQQSGQASVADVAIIGNYAYLGGKIFDISNPANPLPIGDVPFARFVGDAFDYASEPKIWYSSGRYALAFVSWRTEFTLFDVSNAALPVNLGTFDYSATLGEIVVRTVKIVGDVVYVLDVDNGLYILSLANPTSLVYLGEYTTPPGRDFPRDIVVDGNRAFIMFAWGGLDIVDVSNPRNPVPLSDPLSDPDFGQGDATMVDVDANRAYVVDGEGGLRIFDVSDPTHPLPLGRYRNRREGDVTGIQAIGKQVYLAGSAVQIIDVSDPATPVMAGVYRGIFSTGIHVAGNRAYVAEFGGLTLLDVSDAANPKLLGRYKSDKAPQSVQVVGNLAYLAEYQGLRILDVSEPTQPVLVGSHSSISIGWNANVKLSGNLAFLIAPNFGFEIVDVTNPAQPKSLGHQQPGDYSYAVDLQIVGNHYLFLFF